MIEKKRRMKSRARYDEDLKKEPTSVFWLWHQHWMSADAADPMLDTRLLAGAETLADKFPIVLGLSDQGMDAFLMEPMMRFLKIVGAEDVNYIPNSNANWPYESSRQSNKISMLLAEVISRAFNLPAPMPCGASRKTEGTAKTEGSDDGLGEAAKAPEKAAGEARSGRDTASDSAP